MNAMGHDVPTMIGVDQSKLVDRITSLVPDYMSMGESGMADMVGMEMPLPDNTLPMMSGQGQFGSIEMGGMFTTVKIREGLARNDYKDPGAYKHPAGTVAYEINSELPPVQRQTETPSEDGVEFKVRKPMGHSDH